LGWAERTAAPGGDLSASSDELIAICASLNLGPLSLVGQATDHSRDDRGAASPSAATRSSALPSISFPHESADRGATAALQSGDPLSRLLHRRSALVRRQNCLCAGSPRTHVPMTLGPARNTKSGARAALVKVSGAAQARRELAARPDAELPVRVAEVKLDRLRAEVQTGSGFAIRRAFRDRTRDRQFL
jgi:hypothetical protein